MSDGTGGAGYSMTEIKTQGQQLLSLNLALLRHAAAATATVYVFVCVCVCVCVSECVMLCCHMRFTCLALWRY